MGRIGAGLAASVAVVVMLVIPVIVMLRLPPPGTPTRLPDTVAVVLLAAAGVVAGLTVRAARSRPAFAITVALVVTLLALWFQTETWLRAPAVPTPPILPNVAPTLVLLAGVFVVTALAAAWGARRRPGERGTADAAEPGGPGRSWSASTIVLGAVTAVVVVTVVEGDVWGRRRLRETFEGPWGLSLLRWLLVLFVGLLIAGALLGWVASSVRHAPLAPMVALALLAATVLSIWLAAGLDGPPRNTIYGLSGGILAVSAAMSSRTRRPPAVDVDRDTHAATET